MRPQLYIRRERDAVDLFAAFMNVTSMDATEQNFAKLRRVVSRAEKRIVKEVRMKKMDGVSVGKHPFFQKRGSYDGEKMVVPLRISFTPEGMQYYDDIVKFARRLGFKEKAMAVIARGTNNRGTIEEFDVKRPNTHDSMSHMVGRKVARELLMIARDLIAVRPIREQKRELEDVWVEEKRRIYKKYADEIEGVHHALDSAESEFFHMLRRKKLLKKMDIANPDDQKELRKLMQKALWENVKDWGNL